MFYQRVNKILLHRTFLFKIHRNSTLRVRVFYSFALLRICKGTERIRQRSRKWERIQGREGEREERRCISCAQIVSFIIRYSSFHHSIQLIRLNELNCYSFLPLSFFFVCLSYSQLGIALNVCVSVIISYVMQYGCVLRSLLPKT